MFTSRPPKATAATTSFELPWQTPLTGLDEDSVSHEIVKVDASNNLELNAGDLSAQVFGEVLMATGSIFGPSIYDTAARDALSPPRAGIVIYNSDDQELQYYNGSTWLAVGGGGSGDGILYTTIDMAGKYVTASGSTTLELAGGGVYEPLRLFPSIPSDDPLFFRIILASTVDGTYVRVKLWNHTAGAYVGNLDGASHDYLQTSSPSSTILLSQNLSLGTTATNFTYTSDDVYEVHVQSTNASAQALLTRAEFIHLPP